MELIFGSLEVGVDLDILWGAAPCSTRALVALCELDDMLAAIVPYYLLCS
jgi:hypothetical protein